MQELRFVIHELVLNRNLFSFCISDPRPDLTLSQPYYISEARFDNVRLLYDTIDKVVDVRDGFIKSVVRIDTFRGYFMEIPGPIMNISPV